MITIWRSLLDAFWIWELGKVKVNITVLRNMGTIAKEELGLKGWFLPLVPYPLKDEVGVGLVCVTLMLSLRKELYVGHLQWDSMRKSLTIWTNIYGAGVLEIGNTIFARVSKNFTDNACPTQGPWFGNL